MSLHNSTDLSIECEILTYDTIVIGTGAAGYNAACRLKQLDSKSVAIVTENINFGTSRNTGSDKQTYYKLGLGGEAPDSVRKMAENLFAGGCTDGDNALCEAALSTRCFLHLCELGIPFPVNRYGEYIGYKTDHDPYARATSVGPLTSKYMTEALEQKATTLQIPVYDGYLAIEILKTADRVCGLLCLEKKTGKYKAFRCEQLILATGGPGGIYADSVYPGCHTGTSSLALMAGAKAQNLTYWQFGLASVAPRWNVSGTYMQVLPRFVSVDEDGQEHEFLLDFFEDPYDALSTVFLKGYQWPFDSRKILSGSSVIDLLVYRECVYKKRKVYLDFTKNPFRLSSICYEKLSSEAYPAVDLYRSKGVDITQKYLQIALCAQHHNGGIAVDLWWQTSLKGLYAVGECAGTHGISRPGGSALNAGQAGSLRAAQHISALGSSVSEDSSDTAAFSALLSETLNRHASVKKALFVDSPEKLSVQKVILRALRRMSDCAGAIRSKEIMTDALTSIRKDLANLQQLVSMDGIHELYLYYKLKDILVTQSCVIAAMIDYTEHTDETHGSALYVQSQGILREGLDESFRFQPGGDTGTQDIQELVYEADDFHIQWRPVRPIPEADDFFENVWTGYRKNLNIY